MIEAGIIGNKVGMTRLFTQDGQSVAVTVIQASPNTIMSIEHYNDSSDNVTLCFGQEVELGKMAKPMSGQYRKADLLGQEGLRTLRMVKTERAIKDQLTVGQFIVGSYVDVAGISKGKGFQGVIKRHNFGMQPATHGNSLSHRAHGSTGQCQDPGKVFKGKKMAGQMGNTRVTQQSLEVMKVDAEQGLLIVKGSIPGAPGTTVEVKTSVKKKSKGGEA